MKKIIFALIVALLPISVFSAGFTDMEHYGWAKEAVDTLEEKGIINGMSDGVFYPEGNVTFEQIAKMAVLSFGSDASVPSVPSFEDVSTDRWSYEYIEKSKAWFTTEDNKFYPEKPAERWQVAGAAIRALGLEATDKTVFSDQNEMTDEIARIANAAVEYGIIEGYPDGSFRPMQRVTRAEAAVIIHRALSVELPETETETETKPETKPEAKPETETETESTPAEKDVRMDFYVINDTTDVIAENGDVTVKLNGYHSGESVDFTCERAFLKHPDGTKDDTITFSTGDVAVAVRDITTNVRWITKLFDLSDLYSGNTVINPYNKVDIYKTGYLTYSFGLVRNLTAKSISLVQDDTATDQRNIYAFGEDVNFYQYNRRKNKIEPADRSDITADKTPSGNPVTEDGCYTITLRRDNKVSDVLILYNE